MSDNIKNAPILSFTMGLPAEATGVYQEGILKLLNADRTVANEYRGSSSRPWHQYWASWRKTGGVLPPSEPYTVDLLPSQSNLDGIRGDFYAINPYEVKTIGDTRAAFGLHNDANRDSALGSMGCLVPLTERGWAAIRRDLRAIQKKFGGDLEAIALEVSYFRI
jgi:hypothetical protein